MRYYGTIIRWNENRQFGAIQEESTENEIFAPLSAFQGRLESPVQGKRVSFNLIKGRKGRDEAEDIRFADELDEFDGFLADTESLQRSNAGNSRAGGVVLALVLAAALIGGGAWYGWQKWQQYQAEAAAEAAKPPVSMVEAVAAQMKEERKAWKDAVKSGSAKPAPAKQFAAVSTSSANDTKQKFSCDGRQYCSQMTSREEAKFFIANCADTKMDSDHDGEPCEHDSRW